MSKLNKLANIFHSLNNDNDDDDTLFFDPHDIDTESDTHHFVPSGSRTLRGGAGEDETVALPTTVLESTSERPSHCYIVVPDSGYANRPEELKLFVYGAIHPSVKNRVPILFDDASVNDLITKMTTHTEKEGTLHGSTSCPYPVGGFVVVKCTIPGDMSTESTLDSDLFTEKGERDYAKINSSPNNIVMYKVEGDSTVRGLIKNSALKSLTIEAIRYGNKFDIDEHVKNVLLNNTCPGLNSESLKLLNKAWKAFSDTSTEYVLQEGGDYMAKYLEEKAKYRKLKALYSKQSGY